MYGFRARSSFLIRDNKLFLELSQSEADEWIPKVFDKIRPSMNALCAVLFDEDEPANLPLILDLTMDQVREVAREMADCLMTPDRLRVIFPRLDGYCDELLADGRDREAAFIQTGLIQMARCIARAEQPQRNSLLVEICAQAIYQHIEAMSTIDRSAPCSH